MFATIRQYEMVLNPDELVRQVESSLLPLMKQIKGFVSYYFIDVGQSGGRMVSVSVFETEAAATESNEVAAKWASERRGLLPPIAGTEQGPVVVGR